MRVGDLVALNRECLGNPEHTEGIVFHIYDGGCQIIFPNGNYDGFSEREYDWFYKLDHSNKYENYHFTNVMQVSQDFDNNYWDYLKEIQ